MKVYFRFLLHVVFGCCGWQLSNRKEFGEFFVNAKIEMECGVDGCFLRLFMMIMVFWLV
jgi:hypothetical protein